jgi:hypothetical protein
VEVSAQNSTLFPGGGVLKKQADHAVNFDLESGGNFKGELARDDPILDKPSLIEVIKKLIPKSECF